MKLIFSQLNPKPNKPIAILYSLPDQNMSDDIQNQLNMIYEKYQNENSDDETIAYHSGPYLSYIFKVESAWDSGLKETFMLTLYFEEHENTHFFSSVVQETISNLQSLPNLTKLISVNTPHGDKESYAIFGKVIKILTEGYFEASKLHATYNLGLSEVLILGDKGSGKTSIVDYLIHGDFVPQSSPTLTPQVYQLVYDQVDFRVLDICCEEHLQEIFEDHPIEKGKLPQAIVYVIDASKSVEELNQSVEEFDYWINFLKKQYNKAVFHTIPFLVLFNKKDLNPNFYIEVFKEMYTFEDSNLNLKYAATSAKTGEGLNENFSWLLKQIKITETY
jgi:GTPase SAR1 family protein